MNDRLPSLPSSGGAAAGSFIAATASARNASRSGTSPTMAQLVAFPFGPVVSSSRSTNGPVVRLPIHDLFRKTVSPGAFSLLSASGRIRRTVAFAAMRSKSGNSSVHMT
jgi:hypothetical protein